MYFINLASRLMTYPLVPSTQRSRMWKAAAGITSCAYVKDLMGKEETVCDLAGEHLACGLAKLLLHQEWTFHWRCGIDLLSPCSCAVEKLVKCNPHMPQASPVITKGGPAACLCILAWLD